MNKNEIGFNAGKVWHVLSNNAVWNCKDLQASTGLSDRNLWAAIGWLARENKVELWQEDDKIFISLGVNVYIG